MGWKSTFLFVVISATSCTAKLEIPNEVPADFQLEYRLSPIGVTPANEKFILIDGVDPLSGKARIKSGTRTRYLDEKPERVTTAVEQQRELSAGECLRLYRFLTAERFLDLDDSYSSSETVSGGSSRSLRVTARGSTKRVVLSANATVKAFERILEKVRVLAADR